MAYTSLQQEMQQYFSLLNEAEQQSIISLIKTFVAAGRKSTVSMEAYTAELDAADAEIEAGNYVSHEEVKKRFL
jgi:predicted transcriptional regulator